MSSESRTVVQGLVYIHLSHFHLPRYYPKHKPKYQQKNNLCISRNTPKYVKTYTWHILIFSQLFQQFRILNCVCSMLRVGWLFPLGERTAPVSAPIEGSSVFPARAIPRARARVTHQRWFRQSRQSGRPAKTKHGEHAGAL